MGSDEVNPLSGIPNRYWGGLGMMVVESADTLYMMGLKGEFDQAAEWIHTHLTFDLDHYTSVFETIIRMLGGLLSGYALSGDRVFLEKAEDLADRLLKSYDGVLNHPNVNLASGEGSQMETTICLAEAATNYLEFLYSFRVDTM